MEKLKEKIAKKVAVRAEEIKAFLKESGKEVISQVTVDQAFGGGRGVKMLICETSLLDPEEGIRFRGYTIPELSEKLPKATKSGEPLPEGVLYLLLTGDIPTAEEVKEIQEEFKKRSAVPQYVFDMIRSLPVDTHPMTQFSLAILSMQKESLFEKAYRCGAPRSKYWE
ncbi:MAG TPA: citrate/2-methylcitrate synthase, partial [bacterium]